MEYAIIIVNYRTPKLVIDVLQSLEGQVDGERGKVIVVDNHSGDDSLIKINKACEKNEWSGWVDIIESKENGGFSSGNNIGIMHVDADFYVLLNSDTIVRPGAIKIIVDKIRRDQGIGIVTPRLEWPDGSPQENCFNYRTPINELLTVASTGFITRFFNLFGIKEVVRYGENKCEDPDWVSFACVAISKKAINNAGYMDSGYFMYLEDIDYSRRVKDLGYKVESCRDARIVHLNNGLLKSGIRKRLPKFYYESRSRYFIKFYGLKGLLTANIFWTLGFVISVIRVLFGRQLTVPQYSWLDIWKHMDMAQSNCRKS